MKKMKSNTWLSILSNRYVLLSVAFVVWMVFFDTNSWLIHRELDEEIEVLEQRKSQFEQDIKKDNDFVTQMQDTFEMERYARSQYYLKKENETIFLIEEADSTQNNSAQ
ncbi:MAG: septum formation initiator family protein [Flavobacteriaceae bacterium]|jgi:cell division protein DivIC|nr:septum formation initiator family protein [Flavobacteriaceae bacterium]